MGDAVNVAVFIGGNNGYQDFVGEADQGLSFFANLFLVHAEFVRTVCPGDGGVPVLDF